MKLKHASLYAAACLLLSCGSTDNSKRVVAPVNTDSTFTNPLLPSGPDPWVIQKDSVYYYTNTFGNKIAIYKTGKMSALSSNAPNTIWSPPVSGPYSNDIWAPELHYLQNKWYVYFAADNGDNSTHRIYVLENSSQDPLSGSWVLKGKIAMAEDKWAIDPSVFTYQDSLYMIWSGWEGDTDVAENIYIAAMQDPLTISGPRVLLSSPKYSWENNGAPPSINEGPESIINNKGQLLLTYSASGCWTDNYCMGLLTLKPGGHPLNSADWVKSPSPVFTTVAGNGAYSPGHNGFFMSKDGTENWIIYHANSLAGQGCGDTRNPRMQKFTWNADGSPAFGQPVPINVPIKKPSGE